MRKTKVLLAAVLSATIVLGGVNTAHAADSEQSAQVMIDVKATALDNTVVTVPGTLPVVFNEDGTNLLPTDWSIENGSAIAGIHLEKVEMDAKDSGWKLLSDSADTKTLPADSKSIQFYMGKAGELKLIAPTSGSEASTGSFAFEADDISIPSGGEQVISFDINRGAFKTAKAAAKAFDMVLTFQFN